MFPAASGSFLGGLGGMPSSNPSFAAPAGSSFTGAAASSFGTPAPTQIPSFGYPSNAVSGQFPFSSSAPTSTGIFGGAQPQGAFNTGGTGASSSFGYSSAAPAGFPGGSFNVQPQQQWLGGQKLADIAMAYASHIDANGRPVPVSSIDSGVSPSIQTQAPQIQPGGWAGGLLSTNQPAVAPSLPQVNKSCEFEIIAYDLNSKYPSNKPYVRPSHVGNRRWLQADRENPDPDHVVPILVVGCDGLKKRFEDHYSDTEKLKGYVSGLKDQLHVLDRALESSTVRFSELKSRQRRHHLKLLQVMRKLEVLRTKGLPLGSLELRYQEKVEELYSNAKGPYSKLQLLETSQSVVERQNDLFLSAPAFREEDLESICTVLQKQREGLQHLTDIVRKDSRDINMMKTVLSDRYGITP